MTYYDTISEGYEQLYGSEQQIKAGIILSELKPKKNTLLLDVGCGPASYFSLFSCKKIGIDPSLGLLKNAKDGLFIQAVAEKLPFKNCTFDYVISITAVHNFTSIQAGLSEIQRVAKKKVALSIMRQTQKMPEIQKTIDQLFKTKKIIMQEKDIIYILEKRIKPIQSKPKTRKNINS